MVIVATSAACPVEPKCEARNKSLKCTGGFHGKYFNSTRNRIQTLVLCGWPDSTLDLSLIQNRFPGLKNLTVVDSNVTRLLPFQGDMKKLEVILLNRLNVEWIEGTTFTKLGKLRVVDLRNNKLNHIERIVFASVPALREVYLSGNPWDCQNDLIWMIDDERNTSLLRRIVDQDKMMCTDEKYRRRPVLPVMGLLKTLNEECPRDPPLNCTCQMDYIAPDPDGRTLRPVTTINCSYRGLVELPDVLPSATTILLVNGNQISSVKPLVNNPHYSHVHDVYLDDNIVSSIEDLEGSDWLLNFRVLSLRNNYLKQVPTYALDNALQRNRNVGIVNLGNNPWRCDCLFTPSFQDFIIKYRQLVKDIDDVKCSSDSGDDNSLSQIQTLSRSSICREPSEFLIRPLDLLNGILASLIILVIGKLMYDYWSFKKTGKLPWIVAKMP